MAYLRKEPLCDWDREWEKKQLPKACPIRHTNPNTPVRKRVECFVTPDDGTYGPEFVLTKTVAEFKKAARESNCDIQDEDLFNLFSRCLNGDTQAKWDKVMDEFFEQVAGAVLPVGDIPPRRTTATFWGHAIPRLMDEVIGEINPRDHVYRRFLRGWKKPFDWTVRHF